MNNMTANNNHNKDREMSLCMVNEPTATHGLRYHRPENKCTIPPHERKNMIYLEFDNNSESKLCKLFGSEEEAEIAIKILHNAPPEQQVVALQLFKMIGINVKADFPEKHTVSVTWPSPILGKEVYEAYKDIYGEDGIRYIEILDSSPYEISVISRVISNIQEKRGE